MLLLLAGYAPVTVPFVPDPRHMFYAAPEAGLTFIAAPYAFVLVGTP